MKQGIYWVQRHLADQKAASRAAVARQREEERLLAAKALSVRYARIVSQVTVFMNAHSELTCTSQKQVTRLQEAMEQWNEVQKGECADGDALSNTKLNKLATKGKSLIVVVAKLEGLDPVWLPEAKTLTVEGKVLDFA